METYNGVSDFWNKVFDDHTSMIAFG